MELAKPNIDVGIYTNRREEQLQFWQESVGLTFEELLKVGGGTHQLRHNLNGSVLKINHVRAPLGVDDPTGFAKLMIAKDDIADTQELIDPDGNQVCLVPNGHLGINQIGMVMSVSSIATYQHFYRNILEIDEINPTTFKWGNTLFFLERAHRDRPPMRDMRGASGFRYLTVQVFSVDRDHKAFVERGGKSAAEPATLGTTARISFIKDPDGNWIEISQRASLTGSIEVVD